MSPELLQRRQNESETDDYVGRSAKTSPDVPKRKRPALLDATLRRNGWPGGRGARGGIRGKFHLVSHGRVWTCFIRNKGFWMHLEGDGRVVHGRTRDSCVENLVQMLDPEVERIIWK